MKSPGRDSNRRPQRLKASTLTTIPPSPFSNEIWHNCLMTYFTVDRRNTENFIQWKITNWSYETLHSCLMKQFTIVKGNTSQLSHKILCWLYPKDSCSVSVSLSSLVARGAWSFLCGRFSFPCLRMTAKYHKNNPLRNTLVTLGVLCPV